MAKISYIDATCIYEGATAPSVAELSLDVEDGWSQWWDSRKPWQTAYRRW